MVADCKGGLGGCSRFEVLLSMFFAVQCKRIVVARLKSLIELSAYLESAKILLGIKLLEESEHETELPEHPQP